MKKKGDPKTGGRKKGTPNKATASVKEALREAFDQMGGVPALLRWGKKNPTEFYKLWGRMLPQEIEIGGKPMRVAIVEEIIDARNDPKDGQTPPDSTGVPPV